MATNLEMKFEDFPGREPMQTTTGAARAAPLAPAGDWRSTVVNGGGPIDENFYIANLKPVTTGR